MPANCSIQPNALVQLLLKSLGTPSREPSAAQAQGYVTTRRLKPRHVLFRAGQRLSTIYVVRTGHLKIVRRTDTIERIVHFSMKDDWVGLDGIGLGEHVCDAVALTDTELIALPFEHLVALTYSDPALHRALYETLSLSLYACEHDADLMAITGAEQRVAHFLMLQASRQAMCGLPKKAFNLPMTRRDMAAFLGLTLETVSRALSSLAHAGLIQVERRAVHILDAGGLGGCTFNRSTTQRRAHVTPGVGDSVDAQCLDPVTPDFLG